MMQQHLNPPFVIGTFENDRGRFPGVVADGKVRDLRAILPQIAATGELFQSWDANLDAIERVMSNPNTLAELDSWEIEQLRVLPPVQPLGPILAAGANYREHILQMSVAHKLGRSDATDEELWAEAAEENDRRRAHGDPYVWTGIPSAISGPFDDVQLPEVGEDIDWELELGVVIGTPTHHVAVEDAIESVAGYVIVNDISARSLVPRPDVSNIGTDWFRSKNQPTFFPTGPWLVPARYVTDLAALRIELRLNGQVMQDSTTGDMLFDVPQLISYVSSYAILQPGDLLITGSPAGNGSHWKRFLRDGDVMEGTITGLGTQRNRVRGKKGLLPPWQQSR